MGTGFSLIRQMNEMSTHSAYQNGVSGLDLCYMWVMLDETFNYHYSASVCANIIPSIVYLNSQ